MKPDATKIRALADCVRAAGVVGAGGGGFSLADKLMARPYHTLIINAGQSEPLICKDWAALAHYGNCVLDGAQILVETLALSKALLATREEFSSALPDLPASARKYKVTLTQLPDIYPLGYEKILKRELLGIPMNAVGAETDSVLVINAETLRNLSWAVRLNRSVTTKLITVAGAVAHPINLQVPIGIPFHDCLALAGGASCDHYTVFHNGVLSGKEINPVSASVSATSLGFVLLPITHSATQLPRESDVMSVLLAERRQSFFKNTIAGRTQAMSAAYALFDLTSYRRARPAFHALNATEEQPSFVCIIPSGRAQSFQPCVAAGEHVTQGQPVATQHESGDIMVHASIDGVVEAVNTQGITIRRTAKKGLPS